MSRQRYEPIPQRDQLHEVINLDNIQNYNYNTAVPNSISSHAPSIASSTRGRTPSIIAPSIPNSPPPSFHTHSSPGTPRPTPSTSTRQSGQSGYAELWGVAPSTVGGPETEIGTIGTSNDALATISGLKQRIEWLEESIGKLLIERDSHICTTTSEGTMRENCCVTFTDASPDLERLLTTQGPGQGRNCCVQFKRTTGATDAKRENKRIGMIFAFVTLFMICVMITVGLASDRGGRGNGGRVYEEGRG